jgi:drug/metabolite transporter (DMT)-like permease
VRPPLSPEKAKLAICLGTVYLVWGASFLFSKLGVTNLPPLLFSGIRFSVAGTVLLLVARAVGATWPKTRADRKIAVNLALLLVVLSNGASIWAIQYLPSSEMAILNSSTALWLAGLGTLGPRGHSLGTNTLIGLGVGTVGVLMVLWPGGALHTGNIWAELLMIGACLSFAVGTIYYRGVHTHTSALAMSGAQMLLGGIVLATLGLAHGDAQQWRPNAPGLISLAYLTFGSSCLAYSAYAWLTRHAAPMLTASFSYVNPAVAAFLGWLVLNEHMTPQQLGGLAAIIIGVLLQTLPMRRANYA